MIGVVQVNVTQTSKKMKAKRKEEIREGRSVPTLLFEIFGFLNPSRRVIGFNVSEMTNGITRSSIGEHEKALYVINAFK